MDEIIRMARQAGFELDCCSLEWHERIKRFAALVIQHKALDQLTAAGQYEEGFAAGAAAEREACAALRSGVALTGTHTPDFEQGFWDGLRAYETAIRARQ